ncbi:hypothetical protein [Chelatococcus sp. YT9]|uniref:hypothetical protein n=1 Tax=Chelatococcus sp. YT9 TaxID=2835635 RepID=UPI001BD17B0D|nr:hypothetical protein [Chelatococcus sp. YT9]MBS7697864.1 hypothetical protein [Chelatococcus sp. YT9]
MKWIAALLGTSPAVLYVALALAVGVPAAFWTYGAWQYRSGRSVGKAEVTLAVERATAAERERQWIANEAAQAVAREQVERLTKSRDRLQSLLKEIADAADQDPLRDACGVGADSSMRLDKIRRPAAGPKTSSR